MRVFDRYDGYEVDLPSEIVPGRFRLLGDVELTAEVRLAAGQALLGDTWNDFLMGEDGAVVRPIRQGEMTAGQFDLLELALSALVRGRKETRFSPLMPASVGELAELGDLELALIERIPHLREINQRPRMSMHYESEAAPLSRVRKVAPGAIAYLAAHSEDWHRRTLSGIAPKRILGLFSEDELTIYENKVYARLLDKLEIYLGQRRSEIAELVRQCEEALELGGAEDLDYRLRKELYALWGDVFSVDETQRLLDASEEAMQALDTLYKQVSVLRNGALYVRVPRALRVPEQLRETNILQHDQHYRHLRTLWRLHQHRPRAKPLTVRQAVERNLALFENYVVYVGRLCHRAMAEFRLLDCRDGHYWFAGQEVRFARHSDEWCLEYGEAELVIVPTFLYEASLPEAGVGTRRRVLVSLLTPGGQVSEKHLGCTADSKCVSVNPGDFYGLEKIKLVIEGFLWSQAFSHYGRPIGKLPTAAGAWLEAKGWAHGGGNGAFAMLGPVDSKEQQAFSEWLQTDEINEQTRAAIRRAADNVQTLASCRECGRRARFEVGSAGFRVRCSTCSTYSQLWTEHGKRVAELSVDSLAPHTFRAQGARYLRLRLP